jgi:hypothetical protein
VCRGGGGVREGRERGLVALGMRVEKVGLASGADLIDAYDDSWYHTPIL